MAAASAAILFFPQGFNSRHFYGRSTSACGSLLTLLCAQQVEQNDCMYMGGEGEIAVDVGLRRASDQRECVISNIMLSGGALAQLHTSAATEELALGLPCPASAAAALQPSAPPRQLPATLHFEPAGLLEGEPASAAAAKFFPDVVASALAQLGSAVQADFLIVRGALQLRNCAWRECSTGAASAAWASATPPPDSVAALLARRFDTREGAELGPRVAVEAAGQGQGQGQGQPPCKHAAHHGWEVSRRPPSAAP